MKKFVLTAILVLVTVSSWAQVTQPRDVLRNQSKKQLLEQNGQLKSSIDSLLMVVDSLRALNLLEEVVEEIETNHHHGRNFNQADHDSLLAIWYESIKAADFDIVHDYDMDAVHFSSNVSDDELVKRLTDMNAFITLPFNETVKNYMILYSEKRQASMERMLGLSHFYFPIFEEVFAKYDLPMELKYMAVIESALNPTATSRAGAKGMWQFMYKTARSYGLQIDSYVDERLDVEKAVDAAARYLRDSYRVFGDWSLAISSYNCGAGNVSKAIRRAGGKTDFWSIYDYLPRETRGYMPAFVGAMYAFTYAREYGLSPMDVGMPAQVDTFEIRKKLHFRQINEVVGVPMEDLQNLNPQYLHDVIPGTSAAPCVLNLPFNWTGPFMAADQDSLYLHRAKDLLADDIDRASSGSSSGSGSGERVSYKVKKGDTLGKIASKYHVSVAQIRSWNHLRSDSIRIGQVLYVYPYGVTTKPAASTSSSSSSAASAGSTTGSAAAGAGSGVSGSAAQTIGQVAEQMAAKSQPETASETESETASETDSEPASEPEQSKLTEPETASEPETTKPETAESEQPKNEPAVAEAQPVSRTDNNSSAWYSAVNASATSTAANTEETSQSAAEAAPQFTTYVVKKGDSLFGITKKFPGVTIIDIQEANKMSGTAIQVGQKLQIPVK